MWLSVFDNAPPPAWQWAGLILGFVALVVGMVTLPQVIWGAPNIVLSLAGTRTQELSVFVRNTPCPPLLRRFVRRETAAVSGSFVLTPIDSPSQDHMVAKLTSLTTQETAYTIHIPAAHIGGAHLPIVKLEDGDAFATGLGRQDTTERRKLALGEYACIAIVEYGGRVKSVKAVLGVTRDYLYWR